jgi:signal transduction histidine kinase
MSTNNLSGSGSASPLPWAEWCDPDSPAHVVQFYQDDAFLLDELSRFIGSALVAGDCGIVIATESHRQGIAWRLRSRGLDVGVAVEQGRYIALDAETILANLMVDKLPDPARLAAIMGGLMGRAKSLADGRQVHVRVFGEMVTLLWAQGNREAAIRLEQIWRELAQKHGFSLRCAYPIGDFGRAADSQAFLQICAEHTGVIPAESYIELAGTEARLRQISHLQQQAQALELEVVERMELEKCIRLQEAELLRSEKTAETGRLAASIAHEINNPLESLTNLLYLLQASPSLDNTARQWADLADQELRRIAHITKQMLAFYRVSTRPVPFSLAAILDEVLGLFEPKLTARKIYVRKRYTGEGALVGFPSEIRQLFANLIGNAIEATGRHGMLRVHLYESCDWRNSARRGIRISIADTGAGIAAENREKIFQPFFTTKGEAGTGLGLWVSRGIVAKHEGTIRFRSNLWPGHSGTIFAVFLPFAAAEQREGLALAGVKTAA